MDGWNLNTRPTDPVSVDVVIGRYQGGWNLGHAPPTPRSVDLIAMTGWQVKGPHRPRVGGAHDWQLRRDSDKKNAPPTPRRWT